MIREGNCWDDALIERFFLGLQMESDWHSYDQVTVGTEPVAA